MLYIPTIDFKFRNRLKWRPVKHIFCPALKIVENKRTNGPVNAHLRTGIYKIGQGHPKVMIYINFVELLSLMLLAKFQNHRPSGTGEEDFKGFLLFIAMAAILVM